MSSIKLNVIYVRHMYSCANYNKTKGNLCFWAISDPSLHCVGVEQAKLLGEDFKKSGINIDMICTSQMFRAIQSGIIIRDTVNKDIPIRVVRHISEKGITPDNVPKKIKKITEEKAKEFNMTIDYNTDNKTSFKKFEKDVIPDVLNSLMSIKRKEEYTIVVITHSHLLKHKFKKTLDNGQMVFIQYILSKNKHDVYSISSDKELPVPKELSSPYMNNQFYIYECTICEDINKKDIDKTDFLILDNLEKKMELERFIIKKDIYETYKFKTHKQIDMVEAVDIVDIVDMIIVKIPCDIENDPNKIEKYLEKYRKDDNKLIAGISSNTNLNKDIEDIKKTLIKLKPGCEEYNILFLQ